MTPNLFDPSVTRQRCGVVPRDYQVQAHDTCFRDFNAGESGVLFRMFTGAGKTLSACLVADTWLQRSPDHRFMVVSYERQLVSQFAQEVEEYLGVEPGIEMEQQSIPWDRVPRIVVASRQTLLTATPPTPEQIKDLTERGIVDLKVTTKRQADVYMKHLRRGGDVQTVLEDIEAKSIEPEADGTAWSRLHKFRHELHWLVCFDEAHRHAYSLRSVGNIVDWFERNPEHRRIGLTATPIRGDGVSLGHKMFPAIAIDYPLYAKGKPCAVEDGWAVPYLQRYIEVEGVDFRSIQRVSEGGDFDEAALEMTLGEEKKLAKLVQPLLDMVGSRRTLIFSPGVDMAKNVARFINARVPARCECGLVRWHSRALIGDGACCECGRFVDKAQVITWDEQARELDGAVPDKERKSVYDGHQNGKFQFLSVCCLCREAYNDPDISCVAVFRPVSKKARGLAEQMKGRACRPLRSVAKMLHSLPNAAARRAAIASSDKKDALIVDLVGITGLADCASTVDIYAEGLPDEVRDRAAAILAEKAQDEDQDVEEAIEQAKQESEKAATLARLEREEAERRAQEEAERRSKAQAQAKYTAHEVGYGSQVNSNDASDGQHKLIAVLGLKVDGVVLTKNQARKAITMLKKHIPTATVAKSIGLREGQWTPQGPSLNQQNLMGRRNVPIARANSIHDASQLIDARLKPKDYEAKKSDEIAAASRSSDVEAIGKDLETVWGVLPVDACMRLYRANQEREKQLNTVNGDIPE
jgi:superfamily II DNA or RNA helicase